MWQSFRFRLPEWCCHLQQLLADPQRGNPKPWVVALAAMGTGLGMVLMLLAWVGLLRLLAAAVKWLR